MRKKEVSQLLKQIGLRPQKAAGQNFLFDQAVVDRMVEAAKVRADDTVLEIGSGLGILTKALVKTKAKVIAVELDVRLVGYLSQRFKKDQNVKIIHADVFKLNLNDLVSDGQFKLVANLPYSATGLALRNFLTLEPRPTALTIMIQKEVAKRMTAEPGQLSLLGLMSQYYSQPTILFDVPRTSFVPTPAVTSSVVHSTLTPVQDRDESRKIFQLARAAFSGRRKQLHNTFATALHVSVDTVKDEMMKLGISSTLRPQDLSLENWRTLAKSLF